MFATINGISTYYEDSGGDGTPVVLIHGLGGSHESWSHQAPLADEFRLVTYDERGSGRSQKAAGPYSIELFADDLRALLAHLGIERPVLVGLSMGGGIAQTFAMRFPDEVRALGLLSTSSEFPDDIRQRFFWRADVAEKEGMAPIVDGMVERWFSPAFRRDHPDEVAYVRGLQLAHDPRAFAARCRANGQRNWTNRLGEIKCPIVYAGGDLDPANIELNLGIFRRYLPQMEVHVIKGSSHCIQIERPDEVNEIIRTFVRSLPKE